MQYNVSKTTKNETEGRQGAVLRSEVTKLCVSLEMTGEKAAILATSVH